MNYISSSNLYLTLTDIYQPGFVREIRSDESVAIIPLQDEPKSKTLKSFKNRPTLLAQTRHPFLLPAHFHLSKYPWREMPRTWTSSPSN